MTAWNDPEVQVTAEALITNGLVFEINRKILHPLGMAMWADPGEGTIGVAFDDDPAGVHYELPAEIVLERSNALNTLRAGRAQSRRAVHGWEVQPLPECAAS